MKHKVIIARHHTPILESVPVSLSRAENARRELGLHLLQRAGFSIRVIECGGGVKPAEVPGSQDDGGPPRFEDLPEYVEREHHPRAAWGYLEGEDNGHA